jgi:hypothetical protein
MHHSHYLLSQLFDTIDTKHTTHGVGRDNNRTPTPKTRYLASSNRPAPFEFLAHFADNLK